MQSLTRSLRHQLRSRLPETTRSAISALCHRPIYPPDPFGMDLSQMESLLLGAGWLYHHYFRCQTHLSRPLPDGPVILAANHSGQLPFDALMIATALSVESTPPRFCRGMVDKLVPAVPHISSIYTKLGVVLGTPDNARRLLDHGQVILTFPEGMRGIQKTLSQAYRLQPFGLGFIRLAMAHNVPIVPVTVVGAEEQYPTLYQINPRRRGGRGPMIPIWAHLPIPLLGLLPLPVRYHIHFGTAMHFKGDPDDEDDSLRPLADAVAHEIDAVSKRLRQTRPGIFK